MTDIRTALGAFLDAYAESSGDLRAELVRLGVDSPLAFSGLFAAAIRSMLPKPFGMPELTHLASDLSASANVSAYGPRDVEALIRGAFGESLVSSYLETSSDASVMMLRSIEICISRRSDDSSFVKKLVSDTEKALASLGPLLPAIGRAVAVSGVAVLDQLDPQSKLDGPMPPSFLEVQRWPISTAGPRSLVGVWLLSAMFRDQVLRSRFESRKAESGFKWSTADLDFVKLAFDIGIHAYIEPTGSVVEAMRLARGVCVKFGGRLPKLIDLEAVVRSSVGDTDVDLTGIKSTDLMTVHAVTLTYICDILDVSQIGANGLLRTAEDLSMAAGWDPILV